MGALQAIADRVEIVGDKVSITLEIEAVLQQ